MTCCASPAAARYYPERKGCAQMDWRILATTFGLIFLAELGDKTQLAAMAMAAESKAPVNLTKPFGQTRKSV